MFNDLSEEENIAIQAFCNLVSFSQGCWIHRDALALGGIEWTKAIKIYRKSSTSKLSKNSKKFLGELMRLMRLLITGQKDGPSLLIVIGIIGKDKLQKQINYAIQSFNS